MKELNTRKSIHLTFTFSSTFKIMDPSEYEIILPYLMTDSYPHGFTKVRKMNLRKRASKYLAINDKLVKLFEGKQLLVIKTDDIPSILREVHDNIGHQWARYSYNIAKDRYFCPGMLKQIRSYVDNCIRCQKNQHYNVSQLLLRCGFV